MTGAAAGGIAGAGLVNSAIQGGVAIAQSNKAWERQKKVLKNAIQWRVADLRKAGLNPILAAQGALGGAGAGSAPPMANLPDMGRATAEAGKLYLDGKRVDPEIALTKQQIDTSRSQAGASDAAAAASAAQADQTKAVTEGIRSDNVIKAIDADIASSPEGQASRKANALMGDNPMLAPLRTGAGAMGWAKDMLDSLGANAERKNPKGTRPKQNMLERGRRKPTNTRRKK